MYIPTEYLNPDEFEKFANSIVGILFDKRIICFGEGPDDGIDGLDDSKNPTIIVQSKRYQPSTQPSKFLSIVKSEISKLVKTLEKFDYNVDFDYVIVTSVKLNPRTRQAIRNLKPEWIKSEKHIIDATDLENYSKDPCYIKIFKEYNLVNGRLIDAVAKINLELLELEDYNILSSFDYKYIIETTEIKKAYKTLRENNLVFLVGHPGVGKTVSSQYLGILATKWKDRPAKVIYRSLENTEEVIQIFNSTFKDTKKSLVVIFDDFLGRNSFNAREQDLNKIKRLYSVISKYSNFFIIFNSRIEIMVQGMSDHIEFGKFIEEQEDKKITIDLSKLSDEDKAKILRSNFEKEYNSLVDIEKNNLKKNYNLIRTERFYKKIVEHKNFNPRIIEYIVKESRNININYIDKIKGMLDNPQKVYDEIFRKLSENEQMFLYSLTSFNKYPVKLEKVETLFNNVVDNYGTIDDVYAVIDGSWIRKAYLGENLIIDFLNPSLYDYLTNRLKKDKKCKERIIKNTPYLENIQRVSFEKFNEEISENWENYSDHNQYIGNKILNIIELDAHEKDFKSLIYRFKGSFLVEKNNNFIEMDWNNILQQIKKTNGKIKKNFAFELVWSKHNKMLIDLIFKKTDVKKIINSIYEILLDEFSSETNSLDKTFDELIDFSEENSGCNLFEELRNNLENQITKELNDSYDVYYLIEKYFEKSNNDVYNFISMEDLEFEFDYIGIVYDVIDEYLELLKIEIDENLLDKLDLDFDMIAENSRNFIIDMFYEYIRENYMNKYEDNYSLDFDKKYSNDIDSILNQELV